MNKFFASKLYVIHLRNGKTKEMRNKADAEDYCYENDYDFKKDVEVFDSTKEYKRWISLKGLQKIGHISELKRQVEYEIIPPYYENTLLGVKHVKKYIVDGKVFEKIKEAERYAIDEGYGVRSIVRDIVDEQRFGKRLVESRAVYTADFVYKDITGELVVEDVKSPYTRKEADYVLRRKLMLHVHGIKIKET